jgi:nitrogen fixation NifU-like protein
MYTTTVMDHFINPRNVGQVEEADGFGQIGNPSCGDTIHITIGVKDDRLVEVKFKTFGCPAAVAASSMVTEMATGRTLREAGAITNQAVADALGGLPPKKMHCSNIAADALHLAIQDYLEKCGRGAEVGEVLGGDPKAAASSSP